MRLGEVQEFHATEFFAVSLILNSVDIDTFTEYAQLRNSCCTSYKDDPDLGKMLQTYSNDVIARNGQQVLAGAVRGDVADLLEAGLRCVQSPARGLDDIAYHTSQTVDWLWHAPRSEPCSIDVDTDK